MAADRSGGGRQPGAAVTAVGVEHVRLSYEYLDRSDIDGYGSLFDADAVLHRPGEQEVRGRAEIEAYQARRHQVDRHHVDDVIAAEGRVAVIGRLVGTGGEVGFADFFLLSEHGLLRSQRTFFFAPAD
ncbi:nuclear transport factor 2 family protein [Saccharothrix syringae]|uniref:Nuclear transport factor 2 family protein n=1 Tax=Saccharothrix syringae TaxID=103733 RepID=A0A5Q0H6S8_SACSY|nr:nuclear transport factor 2 family protein [Saccharothrix syringae]QFZ21605.1 nuclear transport factor 2 family protein [Saccharothrix syringae]